MVLGTLCEIMSVFGLRLMVAMGAWLLVTVLASAIHQYVSLAILLAGVAGLLYLLAYYTAMAHNPIEVGQ